MRPYLSVTSITHPREALALASDRATSNRFFSRLPIGDHAPDTNRSAAIWKIGFDATKRGLQLRPVSAMFAPNPSVSRIGGSPMTLVLTLILTSLLLVAALWKLPQLQVRHLKGLRPEEIFDRTNEARKTILARTKRDSQGQRGNPKNSARSAGNRGIHKSH